MHFGAIYYPEHWPETRWPEDAQLMRAAGFTVVRLGEFAWCRMEPQPDHFDFSWLDRAITGLNAQGIAVLLGTPTAGPPPWLVTARDGQADCRQVYEDGRRWEAGSRSLCCVNHPYFIERSRRIVRALGEHYANHPGVLGFQLDNELGMYGTRCLCDACHHAFRAWLQAKYSTIDTLNQRLGMIFGGNEFRAWDEVPIPRRSQDLHNPGLLLDSQRFFSDSNVRYLRMQADVLHAAGVRLPITTNVCHMFGESDGIDGQAVFEQLDVAGWDCYPSQFVSDSLPATLGLLHAIARGYKRARYWMLEQQSGSPMGMVADDPRRARLWTWQSIAHGAELILYFRWRTGRFGGEQYWRGILDHDGAINERYNVIAATGQEVARLSPILDRLRPANQVAILLDFDTYQSLVLNPPGAQLGYRKHAELFYAALQTLGHNADVVYDAADLASYRVVIAPMLRLMDPTLASSLQRFVASGGTLITSLMTATLDRAHTAPAERPPYLLKDVFGVERVEWGSLDAVMTPPKELAGTTLAGALNVVGPVRVEPEPGAGLGSAYVAGVWYDQLVATTTKVLARFGEQAPAAGSPAVTVNHLGSGRAFMIATVFEQRFYDDLLRALLPPQQRAIKSVAGVELVHLRDGDTPVYVVLNHTALPQRVALEGVYDDLLAERVMHGSLELSAYDVAILRSNPSV